MSIEREVIDGLTEALRKGYLKMVMRPDGDVGYVITPDGEAHVEEILYGRKTDGILGENAKAPKNHKIVAVRKRTPK